MSKESEQHRLTSLRNQQPQPDDQEPNDIVHFAMKVLGLTPLEIHQQGLDTKSKRYILAEAESRRRNDPSNTQYQGKQFTAEEILQEKKYQ